MSSTGRIVSSTGASGSSISSMARAAASVAELLAVLTDRRQRRIGEGGGLEVVEADDGDVVPGLESGISDRLERGERHQVRCGEDRGRPLVEREQRAGLAIAGRGGEVAPADQLVGELEAQSRRLLPKRLQSRRARQGVRRAREMRDAAVAERMQMRQRQSNSVRMVRADVGRAAARAPDVDAHQRHVSGRELGRPADRRRPRRSGSPRRSGARARRRRAGAGEGRIPTARVAARSPRAPGRRR